MREDLLNKKLILKSKKAGPWDLGNKVLYTLCKSNFTHTDNQSRIAKFWLIGRTYSVAVERRKNKSKKETNESFYTNKLVSSIHWKILDNRLLRLLKTRTLDKQNYSKVFELHKYLMDELYRITLLHKRSLSSKYLHFHLPNLFYIYDKRASDAISLLRVKPSKKYEELKPLADTQYFNYVVKCIELTAFINAKYKIKLTPRQLDNLLLEIERIYLS
jgi:hypothetical protein